MKQTDIQRNNTHTEQKKDTIHAMQYKAEQNKQSKDQKRAKGVGLEEPRGSKRLETETQVSTLQAWLLCY